VDTTTRDWDRLRSSLRGEVILPGDAGYNLAMQLQDVQFDAVRPQAVTYCADPHDVRTALHFAQDRGLRIAVRSGGHSTAGYSTTTGMVLDVSRLNSVTYDGGLVTIGPGAQAVDVANALAPLDIAAPNGLCPTVCSGGFLAGGGWGFLTRSAGVGSDRMRSAEVVLASGQIVSCSPEAEDDLFWALRGGGGGNFGIVTAYRIDPIHISRAVNFSLAWDWDSAAQVIQAWQRWGPAAPDNLASFLGISLPDAAPGAVPQLVVIGMWQGDPGALDPHLAELTGMIPAAPLFSFSQELPYQQAMMQWWQCGTRTVDQCHRTGYGHGDLPRTSYQSLRGRAFDRPMPPEGVERFLAAFEADRRPGQYRIALCIALAGQVNQLARTDTAYVHRTATYHIDFSVTLTDPAPSEQDTAASASWATGGFEAMDPYSNGESYQNYVDPALGDWPAAYYAENYPRLVQAKRCYDRHGFFQFPQSVGSVG
jgi:FAD/FMN-containing dehydrogenase